MSAWRRRPKLEPSPALWNSRSNVDSSARRQTLVSPCVVLLVEGGRLTDFPVSLQLLPQLGQVGVPAHRGALGHRGHRQHCCQHLTQMSTSHSTVNIVNQLSTSTFSLSCQHCNLDVYSDNFHKCGQHCLEVNIGLKLEAVNIAEKLLSTRPANSEVKTLSFNDLNIRHLLSIISC